eukprot:scaffold3499_cov117-Isochrysis_galbana.AAC.9
MHRKSRTQHGSRPRAATSSDYSNDPGRIHCLRPRYPRSKDARLCSSTVQPIASVSSRRATRRRLACGPPLGSRHAALHALDHREPAHPSGGVRRPPPPLPPPALLVLHGLDPALSPCPSVMFPLTPPLLTPDAPISWQSPSTASAPAADDDIEKKTIETVRSSIGEQPTKSATHAQRAMRPRDHLGSCARRR